MYGYIYEIVNLVNYKKYIGQTVSPKKRHNQHLKMLNTNSHDNHHLQNSYNKYKYKNFDFFVIDTAETQEDLNALEDFYILEAGFPDRDLCYNNVIQHGISNLAYEIYQHQDDICDMYIKNQSAQEIYKKYKCSPSFIYHILHENDIDIAPGRSDLPVDQICEEYINGESSLKLHKKYQCAKGTILKILHDNNIEVGDGSETWFKKGDLPSNTNYNLIRDSDMICQQYTHYIMGMADLCNKYNINVGSISNILKKNGVTPRNDRSRGKIPPNKNSSEISKKGGINYIYKELLNGENSLTIATKVHGSKSSISAYVLRNGTTIKGLKKLDFSQESFIDYPDEICLCLNTKSCLMDCPYCFNKALRKGHYLSSEAAILPIDKNLGHITAISVTGAEPLLNPELDEILKYAKSKGLKTKIDTSLKTDIVIDKNIFQHLDYMNISIKNLEHLQYIDYIINWIIENYDTYLEFNLVYHPQYISKTELKQINEIIKKYDVPLVLVQMDIDFMDSINDKVSKKELIRAAELFDNENIYLLTKEFGREKL
jgi:pyruvate formate lyase activating enzyme